MRSTRSCAPERQSVHDFRVNAQARTCDPDIERRALGSARQRRGHHAPRSRRGGGDPESAEDDPRRAVRDPCGIDSEVQRRARAGEQRFGSLAQGFRRERLARGEDCAQSPQGLQQVPGTFLGERQGFIPHAGRGGVCRQLEGRNDAARRSNGVVDQVRCEGGRQLFGRDIGVGHNSRSRLI